MDVDLKRCELKTVVLTSKNAMTPYFILSLNKEPISKTTLFERHSKDTILSVNGVGSAFQTMVIYGLGDNYRPYSLKILDSDTGGKFDYLYYALPNLKNVNPNVEEACKLNYILDLSDDFLLYCLFKSNIEIDEEKTKQEDFDPYVVKGKGADFDNERKLLTMVKNIGELIRGENVSINLKEGDITLETKVEERGLKDLIDLSCSEEYLTLNEEGKNYFKKLPSIIKKIIDKCLPKDRYCYFWVLENFFRSDKKLEPIYTGDKYELFKEKAQRIFNLVGKNLKRYKKAIEETMGDDVYSTLLDYKSCLSRFKNKFDNEKFRYKLDMRFGFDGNAIYYLFNNPIFKKLDQLYEPLYEHVRYGVELKPLIQNMLISNRALDELEYKFV